jgi:hypothetical protein
MSKLWKDEENKLIKSGRKWAECDELPYRCAELFCEKCGKSMGIHDIVTTNLQTLMYCADCVKPYILTVPFDLTEDKEIVFDNGNMVQIKYKGGYYQELVTYKICYFNKKGRYIKIKGKTYYLNKNTG